MDPPDAKAAANRSGRGTSEPRRVVTTRRRLDLAAVRKVWPDLFKKVGARLGVHLSQVEPVSVIGPDVLVIAANPGYNSVADECGTAESLAKIEQALQRLTHRSVTVKYERSPEVEDVASDGRAGRRDGGKMPCRPTRWFNGCWSFSRPGHTDLNMTIPTRISRHEPAEQ